MSYALYTSVAKGYPGQNGPLVAILSNIAVISNTNDCSIREIN